MSTNEKPCSVFVATAFIIWLVEPESKKSELRARINTAPTGNTTIPTDDLLKPQGKKCENGASEHVIPARLMLWLRYSTTFGNAKAISW